MIFPLGWWTTSDGTEVLLFKSDEAIVLGIDKKGNNLNWLPSGRNKLHPNLDLMAFIRTETNHLLNIDEVALALEYRRVIDAAKSKNVNTETKRIFRNSL